MHFIQLAVEGMFFGVWKLFPFISNVQVPIDMVELPEITQTIISDFLKQNYFNQELVNKDTRVYRSASVNSFV